VSLAIGGGGKRRKEAVRTGGGCRQCRGSRAGVLGGEGLSNIEGGSGENVGGGDGRQKNRRREDVLVSTEVSGKNTPQAGSGKTRNRGGATCPLKKEGRSRADGREAQAARSNEKTGISSNILSVSERKADRRRDWGIGDITERDSWAPARRIRGKNNLYLTGRGAW